MPKFKPKDFIAVILILVYAILKLNGVNGVMDGALGLILGYYFVKRTNGADNGT